MNESSQSVNTRLNKSENLWINLLFNLGLPILILRKGDDWFGDSLADFLGSPPSSTLVSSILLVFAVSFPIGYGISDFFRRRKLNFLSILGAVSALLTGGIGLIPGGTVSMFAIKEAALPGALGLLTVLTLKTKKPLVHMFLYNPDVFQIEKIETLLNSRGTKLAFDRLLCKCTWLLAGTFVFSALLNYFLARALVVTEPFVDKNAFNDEIGQMMAWSFPVISLPCMIASGYAFWLLIKGIRNLTGLEFEEAVLKKSKSANTLS